MCRPLCVRQALSPALSPDGRRLVTSGDRRVVDHEVGGLRELTSLGQQQYSLRAIDFSPDGLSLACMTTVVPQGTGVRWHGTTWRLATGELLRSFSYGVPPRKGELGLAFHPSGEALACGANGSVDIWSLHSDRPRPEFNAFEPLGLPTFDPDGQRLWAVVDDSTVLAWRWPDGGVSCRWENRGGAGLDSIYALAVGRRWVLAGGRDGDTRLLRAQEARPERKLVGPGAAVRAVALSPDESLAATGTQQGTVRLYRLPGGEQLADLTEQREAVETVAFSPGGELLAAGGRDRQVLLYDVRGAGAQLLVRLPCPGGTVQALRFHPDGDRLAVVVQGEKAARVWHLGLLRQRLGEMGLAEGWPPPASPTPSRRDVGEDAPSIAVRGRQRIREGDVDVGLAWLALALRLAEREGSPLGRELRRELTARCAEGEYRTIHTGPASVTAMAASKEGKALAVAYGGEVRLYNRGTPGGGQVGSVLSHPSPVLSLEFSPDGARLLSVSMEGAVRLWDRKAGSARMAQPSGVNCATFSPDGKVIACGGTGNHLRLYDGADGRDLDRGRAVSAPVARMSYRPDGRQLAVDCNDGQLLLFNADLSAAGKIPPTNSKSVSLAYHPNRRTLVVGTSRGTLEHWDSSSLQLVGSVCHQEGAVTTLAFDTSGKLLVSSSGDRVWLWDGDTGLPLQRPLTPPAGATAIVPDAAGRPLLVGGVDGAVRAWSPPAPLVGSAEAISCLVALRTGLEAEPGERPSELEAAALASRARRLRELGGPHVEPIPPAVRAAERGVGLCEQGHREEGLLWLARALESASPRDESLVRRLRTQLAGWGGPAPAPRVVASSPASSPQAAVLFSPDGKSLFAGGAKGRGGLWDIARGRWKWSVDEGDEMRVSLAFSPDGAHILAGHQDRTVSLRDTAAGRLLASLPEQASPYPRVAFAPDSGTFATGDDRGVRLWDARSHKLRATLHRPDLQVENLAFSPEGGPLLGGAWVGRGQATSRRGWEKASARTSDLPWWGMPTGWEEAIPSLVMSFDDQTR